MQKAKHIRFIVLTGILIFVIACGSGAAATPTPNLEATMGAAIAETKAAQQAASPVQPAQPAQQPVDLQATVDAQVQLTMAAQAVPAQPIPEQPTAEPPAPEQPTVEASPADSSGAGEAAMAQLVQELYDSHRVSMKEGEYIKLDDYNNSLYKNRDHEWWRAGTGIQTSDFVLRADVAWRGDANASASGCGFMYSGLAMDDYHFSVISTEGIVHTYRSRGGNVIEMKGGRYSKPLAVSSGTAEIMIILDDKQMTFYVNGEEVVRFKDSYFSSGSIGYAINSYTPKGINCQFTNVELWKIY